MPLRRVVGATNLHQRPNATRWIGKIHDRTPLRATSRGKRRLAALFAEDVPQARAYGWPAASHLPDMTPRDYQEQCDRLWIVKIRPDAVSGGKSRFAAPRLAVRGRCAAIRGLRGFRGLSIVGRDATRPPGADRHERSKKIDVLPRPWARTRATCNPERIVNRRGDLALARVLQLHRPDRDLSLAGKFSGKPWRNCPIGQVAPTRSWSSTTTMCQVRAACAREPVEWGPRRRCARSSPSSELCSRLRHRPRRRARLLSR